ncbi:histidinol-phosphate transaminase [Candidatus Woesearchaeota archaeon]|nr:histidinol-phosphate transaminase [Candidatus Woesearchaeota archaeon]
MILPKKSVQKMKPYNPPLEGRRGLLRLDFNENTVGPSKKVLRALSKASKEEICAYPEYAEFKKKLAKYLQVKPTELALTNATDEAIKLVVDTYMEPNEEIIIPVPTFPMFRFYAEVAGAKISEVPYNKDLTFPTEQVIKKINKNTKIVVLVNPNSPTGTEIPKEDIIKIIKKAKNSIVLLDEAYIQFFKTSYKDLIKKYDNLIIIQTFSKAFGMGGLRLGYAITNEKNARNLLKANSPYSVNTLAVIAASAAIDNQRAVEKYVREVEKAREWFLRWLENYNIQYYPTKANFVLVNLGKRNKEIVRKLRRYGILVRDQSEKALLKNCTRITIGTKKQMKKVLTVMEELL